MGPLRIRGSETTVGVFGSRATSVAIPVACGAPFLRVTTASLGVQDPCRSVRSQMRSRPGLATRMVSLSHENLAQPLMITTKLQRIHVAHSVLLRVDASKRGGEPSGL